MAYIVGIDEAGYGPVLGPLVVSAVAIEVGADVRSETLRTALGDAVTACGRARAGGVVIDDSKKVYGGRRGGRRGLERLERGVLAALGAAGRRPSCVAELLAALAPRTVMDAAELPWYADGRLPLPLAARADDIDRAAQRLGTGLKALGHGSLDVRSEIVLEPRFNARVTALDNKAAVLFETCVDVLRRVLSEAAEVSVHVDRHGGRCHYHGLLQESFPDAWVWTVGESARRSAYRIEAPSVGMNVCFEVGAERGHLAVALASMVSKYVRELFMEMLNRFWGRRCPGLAPTSGYWVDGLRFLAEVRPLLEADGFTLEALRRVR